MHKQCERFNGEENRLARLDCATDRQGKRETEGGGELKPLGLSAGSLAKPNRPLPNCFAASHNL